MMHETAIVTDLLGRAEAEARGDPTVIAALKFRIGALSGIRPESLRHCTDRVAFGMWGYSPELHIEESHDPTDPNAQGVVLVSVRLEA
jgi:Zn finger protein HypA/HybF involved in hydrogenase expression